MAGQLHFPLDHTVLVAEATLLATEHGDSFLDTEEGRTTGPALMWVKDSGTYLMSNARPRPGDDVIYGRAMEPTGPLLDDSGQHYDLTAAICGGDDFAEYIHLDAQTMHLLRTGLAEYAGWLTLGVDGDRFTIGVTK